MLAPMIAATRRRQHVRSFQDQSLLPTDAQQQDDASDQTQQSLQQTLFGWRARAFNDQVYVVFLEHAPIPFGALPSSWITRVGLQALNWMVSAVQPEPVFSHVELMCFPGKLGTSEQHKLVHFSTYMGEMADWQNPGSFYLDDSTRVWRALPLYDRVGLQAAVRSSCERVRGAPYSVARYPLAWTPLRWMGRFALQTVGAPGQCAEVAARVLKLADVDSGMIPERSSAYGPSRLYIAFANYLLRTSAPNDALSYDSASSDGSFDEQGLHSLLERRRFNNSEDNEKYALLHASDLEVASVTHDDAEDEIARLSDATLKALHGPDPARSMQSERHLAKALFRWSHELARRYDDALPDPSRDAAAPERL